MKKILAIFLALITILSITLVACNKDNNTRGDGGNDDDGDNDIIVGTQNSDTNDTGDGTGSDAGNTGTTEWESLGENGVTIYSMVDNLNVRTSTNTNGTNNIYSTQLSTGQSVTAKAKATIKNEEWYEVDFNGNKGYILAEYMTTNKNDTIFNRLDTPEKLTLKQDKEVYARVLPAFGNRTKAETLTRAATIDGKLEKVGVNESGNIWIVEYTKAGSTTAETYYIGNRAFENFEGYGSVGGIG